MQIIRGRAMGSSCAVAFAMILIVIFAHNTYGQYSGECWIADYYNVFKLSGAEAIQVPGFSQPLSLSINAKDGSCWVADTDAIAVKKLSPAGEQLAVLDTTSNPPAFKTNPSSVAVDPRDGSCWVAVIDSIYKFSSDAKQLFKQEGFNEPVIYANPTNGECWVADSNNARVVKLSADGKQVWEKQIEGITQPKSLSVNPNDGSCWVLDAFTHKLAKLASDGKVLVNTTAAPVVTRVSRFPAPLLPKMVELLPPPKTAPMSAPLPVWRSTMRTRMKQVSMCTTVMAVIMIRSM